MAAPNPLRVLVRDASIPCEFEHRGRLRIVHHHVIPFAFELQRVVEDPLEVYAFHLPGPFHVGALQGVMDVFGDTEELVAAVHHLPFGGDPEIAQQCDMRREEFGDPAAVGGRVHVQHPSATERRGQLPDPFERAGLDGAVVVAEMFVEQRHAFEQRIS